MGQAVTEVVKFDPKAKEKIFKIFKEFMASIAELDALGTLGSRLLSGVQQGLELLRRPAIDSTSELIKKVIDSNNTENLKLYIAGGCMNTHDGVRSTEKLHVCRVGLDDHLKKARNLINEVVRLLNDVNIALKTENSLCDETVSDEDLESNEEEATDSNKKPGANDYALLMAIIKVMVNKNFIMQEKIISSLSLRTTSGELETFCLMWSLQPYIDDEIMHRAWKLVPSKEPISFGLEKLLHFKWFVVDLEGNMPSGDIALGGSGWRRWDLLLWTNSRNLIKARCMYVNSVGRND